MLWKIVIMVALLMHGIGHGLFIANAWGAWKTETGHSWLFGGVLRMGQSLEGLLGLLWLVPMLGFLFGTWTYVTGGHDWQFVLVAAAAVSSVMVVLWWNGINASSAFFALAFNLIVLGVAIWSWGAEAARSGS